MTRYERRASGILAPILGAVALQGTTDYPREQKPPGNSLPKKEWRRRKNRRKMQRESRRRNR